MSSNLFGFQELGAKRDKVDFPVAVAVDNVILRSIEMNPNIEGVQFNFQRVDGDTIAFMTDTLLPPKVEWFKEDKVVGDKTVTAEEQYQANVRSFLGYVKHILTACGVSDHDLKSVGQHGSLGEYITAMCKIVNPILNANKIPLYLKTVKDKSGYTKLPKFRGKGVVAPMEEGKPLFEYSDYEQELLDLAGVEGVEIESTTTKATGLDF